MPIARWKEPEGKQNKKKGWGGIKSDTARGFGGCPGRAAASLRSAVRCALLRGPGGPLVVPVPPPPSDFKPGLSRRGPPSWGKKRRLGSKGASSSRWNLGPFAYRIINEAFNQAEFPSLRKELVIPRNNPMFSSWLPCRLPSRDWGGGGGGEN